MLGGCTDTAVVAENVDRLGECTDTAAAVVSENVDRMGGCTDTVAVAENVDRMGGCTMYTIHCTARTIIFIFYK